MDARDAPRGVEWGSWLVAMLAISNKGGIYFFFKSSMALLYAGVVGGCTGPSRTLVSSKA